MLSVKILGLSSSPRSGSNTAILVTEALKGAATIEGVETKFISLRGKRINPCIDCDQCPVEGTYCAQKDDMQKIYDALLWADGMVFGTPVYFQTLNAQMKAVMDRCRPMGGRSGSLLRFKIGGALAVGAGRNHGQEFAIHAIQDFFNVSKMLTVGAVRGAIGVSGLAWRKEKIREDVIHSEIYGDVKSEENAFLLGKLVATCAKVFKEGISMVDPNKLYAEPKRTSPVRQRDWET